MGRGDRCPDTKRFRSVNGTDKFTCLTLIRCEFWIRAHQRFSLFCAIVISLTPRL